MGLDNGKFAVVSSLGKMQLRTVLLLIINIINTQHRCNLVKRMDIFLSSDLGYPVISAFTHLDICNESARCSKLLPGFKFCFASV